MSAAFRNCLAIVAASLTVWAANASPADAMVRNVDARLMTDQPAVTLSELTLSPVKLTIKSVAPEEAELTRTAARRSHGGRHTIPNPRRTNKKRRHRTPRYMVRKNPLPRTSGSGLVGRPGSSAQVDGTFDSQDLIQVFQSGDY